MKKNIFKLGIITILILGLFGCIQPLAMGTWENIQKNPDNTVVTTTLVINETGNEFTAVMTTKVVGNESENLKLPIKSVKFSGSIPVGNSLYVNQLDDVSDEFPRNSYFEVSKDRKVLTLNPGKIKFQKK